MPLYEYACSKCNTVEEHRHSYKETPVIKCALCKRELKRQISVTSFSLKGSGWAKDGYFISPYNSRQKRGK